MTDNRFLTDACCTEPKLVPCTCVTKANVLNVTFLYVNMSVVYNSHYQTTLDSSPTYSVAFKVYSRTNT